MKNIKQMKITPNSEAQELFPIRVLSEKTSIGTSTLRAWERRYGLLKPQRTPKGHRLYSQADIKHISKILDLLDDGHSLATIAGMLSNKSSQHDITENTSDTTTELSSVWEGFIQSTLEATSDFNIERIDAIYNEASSLYPVDMVTDRLILPTLTSLGTGWMQKTEGGIAEEHFYSSWLKNKLGARFHHNYSQAKGARIICACAPGLYHEIGLMLFSLSALTRGYRVLYFGADLPLKELQYIAERSAAKAIVMGTQYKMDQQSSEALSQLIPELKIPLFVGGDSDTTDNNLFENAGGIILGPNISVALRVFESHLPAYSSVKSNNSK